MPAGYVISQSIALHKGRVYDPSLWIQRQSSPIHFFWGSFDLSLAFYYGKKAPRHLGKMVGMPDWVLQDAYSHEVLDAGLWTGNSSLPEDAFYSYLYPESNGYKSAEIASQEAYYNHELGEFILTYADVQKASHPKAKLLDF